MLEAESPTQASQVGQRHMSSHVVTCRMMSHASASRNRFEPVYQEGRHTLGWALLRLKRGVGPESSMKRTNLALGHGWTRLDDVGAFE